MNPVPVPNEAIETYPDFDRENIAPPPGVAIQDCGFLPTLFGSNHSDSIDWPMFLSYWKPSDEEIEQLRQGGHVELAVYARQMVPVSIITLPPKDYLPI